MGTTAGYAVVGLGVTDIGKLGDASILILEAEAASRAIADAGLERSQVGAAVQLISDPGGFIRTRQDDSFARVLGLPINIYMENIGRGGEYAAQGIIAAMKFLDLGIADYVVLSGARDDWSRSRKKKAAGGRGTGSLHNKKEGVWGYEGGYVTAGSFHSLLATRYMHEFGAAPETFGRVAVDQRMWANDHPEAAMRERPLTLENYMDADYLIWPYRLFDCSQQSDGAVAFVLTTEQRARHHERPVYVRGVGFGEQAASLWWERENYVKLPVEPARDAAFRQAGVSLSDIDFAQLYDCFTAEVVLQIEDYGWAGKGEAAGYLSEYGIGPGSPVPINTGGGLLSGYHLGNLTGFAEGVRQLRGEAPGRQVEGASLGVVSGHGGEIVSGQMCSIHSTIVLGKESA